MAKRVCSVLAVSLGTAVLCALPAVKGGVASSPATLVASAALWLAVALACLAAVLDGLEHHFTHRTSTPLPPPAAPLATYREGPPVECPRHPFAR